MKNKVWDKTDNSALNYKAELRKRFLPKEAKVLDLFCGNGEMYRRAYKGRVKKYLGIDNEKIHSDRLCIKTNNIDYILENDISNFNVFDLDDYGSPWRVFYIILRKLFEGIKIFYITDGLILKQKINQNISKFVSATEKIPKGMNIPGLSRWYIDIFQTMLLDVEKRYGWKTQEGKYFFNSKKTVCYWYLKLERI